jgi:hypothetical protein
VALSRKRDAILINMSEYIKRKIRGKKFIGSGATRVVYDLGGGYVLKIAKSKKGILCNKMEVNLYRSSSLKPIKKHLAEIIDYDAKYRWITMKKYDRKFTDSTIYRYKLMQLVKEFWGNGILPSKYVGRYNNPYAPGLRLKLKKHLRLKKNGEIVVIDYGNFRFLRKVNR